MSPGPGARHSIRSARAGSETLVLPIFIHRVMPLSYHTIFLTLTSFTDHHGEQAGLAGGSSRTWHGSPHLQRKLGKTASPISFRFRVFFLFVFSKNITPLFAVGYISEVKLHVTIQ